MKYSNLCKVCHVNIAKVNQNFDYNFYFSFLHILKKLIITQNNFKVITTSTAQENLLWVHWPEYKKKSEGDVEVINR
jgi:hypothetical protein